MIFRRLHLMPFGKSTPGFAPKGIAPAADKAVFTGQEGATNAGRRSPLPSLLIDSRMNGTLGISSGINAGRNGGWMV